ncbi:aldo/keto reductase [Nocardia asteroides]|uniref:Aldo/keto reductase n=1 Tax=Nocardia asteroides NBRC 15531 TaxID=1110697 RepID=U5E467_NOCAS|nr:aldo/keto reductase [Nocardia asteroides]TLF69675.1 aldo/keto reductase [Nocardia asteroides NBRC 15531]UGT49179.1 aldo/keto reductase [Nocardia asteroides]SFL82735.1 Predicted oxidoreductase [Nocardia asteroides]VEG31027.1 General stress protein 69 [Nocardia asteroides]GAD83752.1 putative aldo/keto reductase [Nocardia asteroides NBRC 15531]
MEYRRLGASGLMVPALGFGAGTFGGRGALFSAWGDTDAAQARRLVDISLEAGVTLFDTADVYSEGASEEVLGAAIKGRREQVLLSTKSALPTGPGPHEAGAGRARLIRAVEASLRRLDTDYLDLFQLHAFDAGTPLAETLTALDDLVRAGKIRYVGVSNFAGWELMKTLSTAEALGLEKPVAHQVYYSLVGRDYEWELMPLGVDQGVGAIVWSPLGWGRLTGKVRRGQPLPAGSRLHETAQAGPPVEDEHLYDIVDVLDRIAEETGRSVPQISLNWLLTRPTVASVLIGARNEEQLRQNLGAVGWQLEPEHLAALDAASATTPPYPYYPYHRLPDFARLNPPAVRAA